MTKTSIDDLEQGDTTLADSMEDVGASMTSLSSASGDLSASANTLAERMLELAEVTERSCVTSQPSKPPATD